MNWRRWFVITALFAPFFWPFSSSAREIKDVTGFNTQLADHPVRIVTLAPSLGELAADLAGEHLERIAGVSEFTDYPPALKQVHSIGPFSKVSLEAVAALRPDLVLATTDGNSKDQVAHLREIQVPVVVVRTSSFSDIQESMQLIGDAMGESERAGKMIAQLKTGLARIDARARARREHPRVLLQLGDSPLVVAGGSGFLDEALKRLGAVNVYGDSKMSYPRPSLEDAVHKNPDTIVVMTMDEKTAAEMQAKVSKGWAAFPHLSAVKNHRVRFLLGDMILRPTLRILEGLSLLERTIYGSS